MMEWHNPNFVISKLSPQEYIVDPRYKGQIQTCQLLAKIGTFDPGPGRANVDSGPVAFEMYKKKKHTAMFGL